jgi:membrane protease YdiL (CAAX protease family)
LITAFALVAALAAFGLALSLAYLAERERGLAWLLYGLFAALDLALVPMGLLMKWAGDGGVDVPVSPAMTEMISQIGVLMVLVGAAALILLLPPVRRLVALALPIDPQRVVHTVALQYVVYLIGVSIYTGMAMTMLLADEQALEELARATAEGGLGTLWAQSLGFVVLAFLGVGIGVRRGWRETLERLGLTTFFSWKWWLAATALSLVSSFGMDQVWQFLASESLADVERLSEALFAPYLGAGLIGALTIGLSAGIGEEILFRGAAQPRLGLIFTSVLFAMVHTQYTVSLALVQVFIVGLLLALTRRHANTTTAIAVHTAYNFVLASYAIYST